ncbi:50S ribosome-binding GTPase [bacterium]|nr:50S ribosome-binding GTPase [bacterium]
MTLLTRKELDKLRAAGCTELAKRWEGLERKWQSGNTLTVANTGRVNSGKSTLFNALLDQRRFEEGAVRTTVKGEREKLCTGLELLDTPGTQATSEDDDAAFAAVVEADLIVFVHNSKEPLDRYESEWLTRLGQNLGRERIADRLVFVNSWLDKGEQVQNYSGLQESLRGQVLSALGVSADIWEVSALRYFNGRENKKQGLVKASRIPDFRNYLLQKAEKLRAGLARERKEELVKLTAATSAQLCMHQSVLNSKLSAREQEIKRRYQYKFQSWEHLYERFKNCRKTASSRLQNVKDAYKLNSSVSGWSSDDRRAEYDQFEKSINGY